jgi:hypothetical protein
MGNCFSSSNIEPSGPTPEKTQSAQPTSIPDGTTSTPSPRPDMAMSARARAQAQGDILSQGRHDDGSPPPSPRGDVFTSQHPDRQEMRSRPYPSGGTGPMQRTRSVPMGVTVSPSAPSHWSRRTNMSASPVVHGSGHQRVGTQPMSSLSSAASQITAGRRGGQSRFPFALQSLLPNDFRYAVRL